MSKEESLLAFIRGGVLAIASAEGFKVTKIEVRRLANSKIRVFAHFKEVKRVEC